MINKILEKLDNYQTFWISFWGLLCIVIISTVFMITAYFTINLSYDLIYGRYPKDIPTIQEIKSIEIQDEGNTIIIKKKLSERCRRR